MAKPQTGEKGEFVPTASIFRRFVTADGSSGFKAEPGRYHLYVSLACPFASRALFVRKLKGLEDVISCTIMDWVKGENGWNFTDKLPRCSRDFSYGKEYLRDIYKMADPNYNGRISVPVLWDKNQETIVNNESSEIIRMLNSEFNQFCPSADHQALDLYPEQLRPQINQMNDWIGPTINLGVYHAGFAEAQEAYDTAVQALFTELDKLEVILASNRYLCGDVFTEADVRLFTTLIRFDPVYVGHFKCNKKRLVDYPNIWAYTREIYQMPGVRDTVDQEHIQKHYQLSHRHINPHGIVAIGPDLDYEEPPKREHLSKVG